MIKIEKLLILVFILVSIFACNTEEEIPLEYNEEPIEASESNRYMDALNSKFDALPEEDFAYMNSLPAYDPEEFANALKKESQQSSGNRSTEEVWGIGAGRTVWKWNGASWGQPNPAARLDIVEVAKNGENSVWGIGSGATVWKWNGASWGQPNPAARLYHIAVYSSTIALGIGSNGTLFVTYNGGQNWGYLNRNFTGAVWLSSGGSYPHGILSVSDNVGNLYKYNALTQQLNFITIPFVSNVHTTTSGGGVWAIDLLTKRVYKSLNYLNFSIPNSLMQLSIISSNDNQKAWAIKNDRTVWKTTNSGASWNQPNSAARLDYISAAFN